MLSKAAHFEENMVAMIGNEVDLFFTITCEESANGFES